MKTKVPHEIKAKYRIPSLLTDFQLSMYLHLIEWKWKNLTKEPGVYKGIKYDAILPDEYKDKYHPLYQPLVTELTKHKFKTHKHFGHMASSQAACINLFLPILKDKKFADTILPRINHKFKELAVDQLEKGFQFEYFDQANPLNDHNDAVGTDSDVAIAYYDKSGSLSLWLIEHKLTENEFTTCGGYKSKGNKTKGYCRNGHLILNDYSKCYYQYHCDYRYWEISDRSNIYNLNSLKKKTECPFIGGENQLWRNQLLGYAIKEKRLFKSVHFSVVHHPDNHDLDLTIEQYKKILKRSDLFESYTIRDFIIAAKSINDKDLNNWISWYSGLYKI